MSKKRKSINIVIAFLLFTVVSSMALAGMRISGNYNPLDDFYDCGRVCNFSPMSFDVHNNNIGHDSVTGKNVIIADNASSFFYISTEDFAWNYFMCTLSDVSDDGIVWNFVSKDIKGNVIEEQTWKVTKGENIFALSGSAFSNFTITMDGQADKYYTLSAISLREKYPIFSYKTFLKFTVEFFVLITALLVIFYFLLRRLLVKINFYSPVETLQRIFIKIGNAMVDRIHIDHRPRRQIRRILFAAVLAVTMIGSNYGYYSNLQYYRYLVLICCILLIGVIAVSIERRLTLQDWRNPLVASWFLLWIMACISDFAVDKRYNYCGWIMLGLITFFAFVCSNMERPFDMIEDLMRSMEAYYVVTLIYDLIFRPMIPGMRYCGVYTNPNVYAMYIIVLYVFLLVELDKCQMKGKRNGWNILIRIGVVLTAYQIWMTQSLTGCLALCIITFAWSLSYRIRHKLSKKKVGHFLFAAAALVVAVCCTAGYSWGINHVPQMLGTQVIFPEDDYPIPVVENPSTMQVQAAEVDDSGSGDVEESMVTDKESANFITNSRLYKKIMQSTTLDQLTAGRTTIYLGYIRQMNLFGHYFRADVSGKEWSAHNEIIGLAYRYGVFAVIPYLFILVYYMIYSFRIFKYSYRTNPYAFCIFGVWVAGFSKLMADKFEQPFRSLGWMVFYLLIGILFSNKMRERYGRRKVEEL